MYQSWVQDHEEKIEFAKSHGILIGSFTNYEAAKKMVDAGNPTATSTEDEYDGTIKTVLEQREKYIQEAEKEGAGKKRRRRKTINKS